MKQFTEQEIAERWDALSEKVRGVLFSDKNNDAVWNLCEREGLDMDDDHPEVAGVVAYAFLGLLKPGEIASELKERLPDVEPIKIDRIANTIIAEVLTPTKAAILELQKGGVAEASAPMQMSNEEISEDVVRKPVAPKPIADVTTMKAPASTIFQNRSANPLPQGTGTPLPVKAPTPSQTPARDPSAPMMLHKETGFTPIRPTAPRAVSLDQKISNLFANRPAPTMKAPVPNIAKVQIGSTPINRPAPQAPVVASKETAPRVVHYGPMNAPEKRSAPAPTPAGMGMKKPPVPLGAIGMRSKAPSRPAPAPAPQNPQAPSRIPGVRGVPPPPPPPKAQ